MLPKSAIADLGAFPQKTRPNKHSYAPDLGLVGGLLALAEVAAARLQRRYLDAAPRSDGTRAVLVLERVERRPHHVVRIRRAERFRHHVLHAQGLEHGPHRTAGDDAGAGRRRAQKNLSGAVTAVHIVVQRAAFAQRHPDETALGGFGRLADRLGHLARLAVTEADPAFLVADDHERSEAEAASALDHLGHTIDVDQLVGEFAVALFAVAALAWFTCHDVVPTRYRLLLFRGRQKLSPPSRAASASALTRPW